MRARTLRGSAQLLIQHARSRAKSRGHNCTLTFEDVLDMLEAQGGRCYYSGVPIEWRLPNSQWRMSLERVDNDLGYEKANCVLIAAEFNTPDYSRNKAVHKVYGTAQWSRNKVEQVWGPAPNFVARKK